MVNKTESDCLKIFVRLLEGTEAYVPCYGNVLENGLVEITRNDYLDLEDDATSIWEFLPGDIVRYETHDGCLWAKELISSTVENRRVYELVFLLVHSLGKITIEQTKAFSKEIDFLLKSDCFKQKCHPVVQKWIKENASQSR